MKKINQKQTKSNTIKTIILATITCLILLLLIFFEDIFNINKNDLTLAENTEPSTEIIPANAPKLSAGMIPVKFDGTNWVITTKDDSDWYDYSSGKPAYIMLNDGTYQSELIADMTNKKLASDVAGNETKVVPPDQLGSIYMWIPRFEINNKTNEIKYVQDVKPADDGFTIPDIFMYKQDSETMPDFLLTGVWVEKDVNTNYSSTITQMNLEESIYGFIANAKAAQITTNDISSIQAFVGAGLASARDPILDNPENPNRIILKIINNKNQDPIKAKATYDKGTGIITVQVTYSQYGISKILLDQTTQLISQKTNRILIADTTGIDLEDGEKTIKIIDTKGNEKELTVQVVSKFYAVLYTDGTLAFGKTENPITTKTVGVAFGDISSSTGTPPWMPSYSQSITTVDFVDKISPISTSYWFNGCSNLTQIVGLDNLITKNVTTMYSMFYYCSSLTSLDLSSFDTSSVTSMSYMFRGCSSLTSLNLSNLNMNNVIDMSWMFYNCTELLELNISNCNMNKVENMRGMFYDCTNLTNINFSNVKANSITDMQSMFYNCSSLTSLDLSSFDTSNVTNMSFMFCSCNSLTELDLSNFSASNVTTMAYMFNGCSRLTSLDLSSFDTSNVTTMAYMFNGCSRLTSLDLSSFDTSNVTDMNCMFCNCNSLKKLDLSNFDTRNVTTMQSMFSICNSLTELDLSNFSTSNVTTMAYMFIRCNSLTSLDLSNFDTRSITTMQSMFNSCSNLTTIYVNSSTAMWPDSIKNSTSSSSPYYSMFYKCGTSTVTRK